MAIYDSTKTENQNLFDAINELIDEVKESNRLKKEEQRFWQKVVNDEFLKELVENNENIKNKLG